MFTLIDSRSIKPVLEIQLPNTIQSEKPEACYCVNLKNYEIQLESDIQYRWYISITHNPELHSRDTVAGGLIERCADEGCQIREGPSRCDRDFVLVLTRKGFWTDAMSCLCDLIKSSPDDNTLRRMLDAIIRMAGPELHPK